MNSIRCIRCTIKVVCLDLLCRKVESQEERISFFFFHFLHFRSKTRDFKWNGLSCSWSLARLSFFLVLDWNWSYMFLPPMTAPRLHDGPPAGLTWAFLPLHAIPCHCGDTCCHRPPAGPHRPRFLMHHIFPSCFSFTLRRTFEPFGCWNEITVLEITQPRMRCKLAATNQPNVISHSLNEDILVVD